MRSAKTHYPQVPVEVAKKIAEEQNGAVVEKETPEPPRGPKTKEPNAKSLAQARPESENGEAL